MELPESIIEAAILSVLTPSEIRKMAESAIRQNLGLVTITEAKALLKIGINQARALPIPRVMLADKKIRFAAEDLKTYIRNNTETK